MKITATMAIAIAILITLLLASCSSVPKYPKEQRDAIASCLAEKGVKEYGAFWCPNCAKQQKMFGDSFSIIKERVYIECDPRCDVPQDELPMACRGKQARTAECLAKKVEKYPDWEFPSGQRVMGVTPLEVLAEKAGCAL